MVENAPIPAQPQDLQQIGVAIQAANTILHSFLFSLGRQYLCRPFEKPEYIQLFKPTKPLLGVPHFLRLEQGSSSTADSLQEQLIALQSTMSACHNLEAHKLIFILSSDGSNNHVYLGTLSNNRDFVENLRYSLEGNWLGTGLKLCDLKEQEFKDHIDKPLKERFHYATALTGIPSLNPGYPQSLDRLLRSLRGSPFMYMVIAEPMAETEVNRIIYSLRELMGWAYSLNKVILDETFTESLSEELKQTDSSSEATAIGSGNSYGKSAPFKANIVTMLKLGALGIKTQLGKEYETSIDLGLILAEHLVPELNENGQGTKSQPTTKTSNTSLSQSTEVSRSTARAFRREYINAHAQAAETHLKQYIERFEQALALGCWNVGVYLLAEDSKIAQRGGTQLRGLFSGEKSVFEPIRIHDLEPVKYRLGHRDDGKEFKYGALDALKRFEQPSLALADPDNTQQRRNHPLGSAFNGLTTPLNTQELSMLINLPRTN